MLGTLTAGGPSQSRSRSLSVAPARAQRAQRRALCVVLPLSLPTCLPRTPPGRHRSPRRPPSSLAVPVRFIENPYLRFFLTSIAYIRGSQTSRRSHVAFCLRSQHVFKATGKVRVSFTVSGSRFENTRRKSNVHRKTSCCQNDLRERVHFKVTAISIVLF